MSTVMFSKHTSATTSARVAITLVCQNQTSPRRQLHCRVTFPRPCLSSHNTAMQDVHAQACLAVIQSATARTVVVTVAHKMVILDRTSATTSVRGAITLDHPHLR